MQHPVYGANLLFLLSKQAMGSVHIAERAQSPDTTCRSC